MSHQYLSRELLTLHGAANSSPCNSRHGFPAKQTGVVLFISLIALVAMTLAAIALVRSVDAGNVVAGNLAFKQGAIAASDAAAEAAIGVLFQIADKPPSFNDDPAKGFYATSQDNLDMTGNLNNPNTARVDWDGNNCVGTAQTACIAAAPQIILGNGYTARYIIHRSCANAGPLGNNCTILVHDGIKEGKEEICVGVCEKLKPEGAKGYYRITTRVSGPRNTTSFVETILHF